MLTPDVIELQQTLDFREIIHPELQLIRAFPTPESTAEAAANFIATTVLYQPEATITYATGATMEPVYARLATQVADGSVSFKKTRLVHLDEYWPYPPDGNFSFVRFLRERAQRPLGIPDANACYLNGLAQSPDEEAVRYDQLVTNVTLAILGIGPGGHIGFNERNTLFGTRTHLAHLSEETVYRDQVERGQDTPKTALTQGIANILAAQNIILVAFGPTKGRYLREALYGPIADNCPASALRLVGDKVRVYIDEPKLTRGKTSYLVKRVHPVISDFFAFQL